MKPPKLALLSMGAFFVAVAVSGCSKSNDTAHDSTPTPASSVAGTTLPAAASSTAPFDDVGDVNGAEQIVGFAKLGVVDPVSGSFRPGEAIRRREFIRWLVKANNVLWAASPSKTVRLADRTEASAFPDVATSDADFPYIQGMQDAGYSVGFPNKTFGPDQPLTREQMFAIKNVFDRGSVDPGLAKGIDFARNTVMPPWKDKADISKTYVAGIATGEGGGAANFSLVFGSASLFRPKDAVTRAQAVVAMSAIGDHTFYGTGRRTLDQALAAVATPTP